MHDAVIVGSGAGGGAVAWRLAAAGWRVLVLEKGPRHSRENYGHGAGGLRPGDFVPPVELDPHTVVTLTYPESLNRWKPLYKWFLAIPHYLVLLGLTVASVFVIIAGLFAVVFSGEYPIGLRNFLVGVSRYSLRLQAYVGLLNDQYPPFALSA